MESVLNVKLLHQVARLTTSGAAVMWLVLEAEAVYDFVLHGYDLAEDLEGIPSLVSVCGGGLLIDFRFFRFHRDLVARGLTAIRDGDPALIFNERFQALMRECRAARGHPNYRTPPELNAPYVIEPRTPPQDSGSAFLFFVGGQPITAEEITAYFNDAPSTSIQRRPVGEAFQHGKRTDMFTGIYINSIDRPWPCKRKELLRHQPPPTAPRLVSPLLCLAVWVVVLTGQANPGDASLKAKNLDGDRAAALPAPVDEGGGGHGRGPGSKLSLVPLIFLIFFEVAGGPYGAEPAVQSAGPLFALLGFLIFPFIRAIPESLITADLSTAMPGNGGFVVWADRAFGPFSGSLMDTWKYISRAINGATLPALCADYLARVVPAVASGSAWVATIVTFNAVLSFLNYTGLSVVGWSAVALGVASLSPFVLMSGVALPKIWPHRWGVTAGEKDWKLFFNTLFWNLNYWDSVSTMAGEVEQPGKTFPTALLSSVAMTSLGYLLLLMAATGAIDASLENWGNSFFVDAAGMIAGNWLKYWIEVDAVLSSIGLYSAALSSPPSKPIGSRCLLSTGLPTKSADTAKWPSSRYRS